MPLVVFLSATATLAACGSGTSHSPMLNSEPEEGALLSRAPRTLRLYFKDLPDIDLVVRTGGNQRLSNFLIWETAYSELFFSETLFPDLNWFELATICSLFSRQQRNFGI
mgnify:CR=1 FL=1